MMFKKENLKKKTIYLYWCKNRAETFQNLNKGYILKFVGSFHINLQYECKHSEYKLGFFFCAVTVTA